MTNGIRCPQCRSFLDVRQGVCDRCGAVVAEEGGVASLRGQTCFDCGFESESVFDVCPECGSAVGVECEECGTLNPPTGTVCKSCRANLTSDEPQTSTKKTRRPSPQWPIVIIGAMVVLAFGLYGYLAESSGVFQKHEALYTFLFFALVIGAAYYLSRSVRDQAKPLVVKRRREAGMVEVYRTQDTLRAEFLLDTLRNEGVEATIMNRHFGSYFPWMLKNGVQILVPEDQLEKAENVLASLSAESIPFTDGTEKKS